MMFVVDRKIFVFCSVFTCNNPFLMGLQKLLGSLEWVFKILVQVDAIALFSTYYCSFTYVSQKNFLLYF